MSHFVADFIEWSIWVLSLLVEIPNKQTNKQKNCHAVCWSPFLWTQLLDNYSVLLMVSWLLDCVSWLCIQRSHFLLFLLIGLKEYNQTRKQQYKNKILYTSNSNKWKKSKIVMLNILDKSKIIKISSSYHKLVSVDRIKEEFGETK